MALNRSPLIHLAQTVYDAPLAIIPAKLEAILHAIGPRLTVDQAALDSLLSDGTLSRYSNLAAFDGEGLAAFDGDDEGMTTDSSKQARRPYALTDSGVAIIPVKGTLLKSGSWISAASGCSSYSGIRNAFDAALDDAKVRAICFDVDSPGGTTHGCFELADYIHSRRGEKPSCACANDLAASAAYAIASAADSVWVTSTGAVGSVGVFALHASQEKLDDKMGVRYTYIFHGGHKTDGNPHEALSDAAYADMKAEVDREGEIFEACVAANRNVAAEKIVALQARVKFGAKSLPLLADEVGTLAETIAYLESVADKVDGVDGKAGRATISSEMPAIPPHKTSTSAKSWNGPLAKKRLREGETAEYYRKAYAFQKADTDGHNKSNFTYIHHEVGSDGHVGAANLKACQSSIGVLNGGRAGTVLKGADRKGVYNHVAAHLRDAGKEPSPLASYLSYLDGARAYALETHDLALMTSIGDLLASTDFDVVDVDIDSDTTATTAEIAGGVNDMAAKTGTGVEKKGPKGEDYMKKSKSKGGKADEMCEGADEKEDEKSAASEDEDAGEYTDDDEKNQERPKKSKKAVALAKAKLAAAKAELELLAAAKDDDDEDGEEDEDEDEKKDDKTSDDEEDDEEEPKAAPKKSTKSTKANSAAVEISELCSLAGMPELTNKYLANGYSVTQVRKYLNARRVKSNQEHQVSSSFSFSGNASGMSALDRAIMQAKVMATKQGINESQALASILAEHPEVYEEYDETRRRVAQQGTNRDIVAYATSQQRVMKALHLGTNFGSPPAAMSS